MTMPIEGVVCIVIHQIRDRRRGGYQFVATLEGREICRSRNSVICSAAALLDEGYDPATTVAFQDAEIGDEEVMTLSDAVEWENPRAGRSNPIRATRGGGMTMRFKTQELLDILQCLAGDFPQTFVFAQHEPHRPLKICIDHDLAQRYPAITRAERDAVLRFYTSRVGYLVACTEGAPRYDLDGHVAGHVTADEAAHAATRLAGIMASRVAKRAAAMAAKRAEREAARKKVVAPAPTPPPPPPPPPPASSPLKRPLLTLPAFRREVAR